MCEYAVRREEKEENASKCERMRKGKRKRVRGRSEVVRD